MMCKHALLSGLVLLSTLLATSAAKVPRCKDAMNGNGKLATPASEVPARFSFKAASVDGNLRGVLNYQDREQQIRLKSRELVEYVVLDDASRRMKFIVRDSDDLPHEVIVLACDFGPSAEDDVVEIYLPGAGSAAGELLRGKIRLRSVNCGVTE